MDDVKNKDIERMEKFYDCSCKVRIWKDCFDMFIWFNWLVIEIIIFVVYIV